MKIAVPRERRGGEHRVAATPETVRKFKALGADVAVEAGATSVIQPGGSIRDDEIVAAADAAGLAMVFTGLRHFRH